MASVPPTSRPPGPGQPSPRQLIGLGATLVGSVVFGLIVGWVLDAVLGTTPLFIMVGLAVGILCAVGSSVVQFRKFMRN
ncbi:hypothetical protein FOS14_21680 [Skermania sp. ID1734]|uniref:AtpZ/AtpI family protein n=1 Tax=Skermania sp. ID1734 TaxID=2597516 RepID=UPI00117D0897|nr:hypothetical protein FOS14_21680 [Skermania sp. ID1734]